MKTIGLNTEHLQHFIGNTDIAAIEKEVISAKKMLLDGSGKGNDFLGWVNLPAEISQDEINNIKKDVERLAGKVRLFVVVGIGGSYLGARAVIEALQSEFAMQDIGRKFPYIVYAGHTLSEDYYCQLMQVLDKQDYAVAVISKSGTTTEPAVAFRLIKSHIEKKYCKAEAAKILNAVLDLYPQDAAEADETGGRFSVLTPVGLLPIAMSGYDIDKLLQGARDMREECIRNDKVEENPALLYAAIRNLLYRKGLKVEILENFVPQLKYISEWWKQLYGESEGKEGKGILPHSLSFTTDLHSMGQYVQEGERLMFETVLSVERPQQRIEIPSDEKNLDGINYLVGKTLTEINHNAELGTILAHCDGGVPVLRILIPEVNEYVLGQLIYFFEFACGVSGYVLQVNPFDQPGVEAYKKNMFRLLGKPGYADK